MHSNFLLPYTSSPSRVTTHSQTLIDTIFSNKIEVESFRPLYTVSAVKKQQFTLGKERDETNSRLQKD